MTIQRARATAQLLGADAGTRPAVDVVRHLLAVQAQDGRAVDRALAVRGAEVDRDRAVEPARAVRGAQAGREGLVLTWLNRGTLHLCAREDWPWLLALTAPTAAAASKRRLAQLGVDPDRAVPALVAALQDGPLDRAGVRATLDRAGVPSEGQAAPHAIHAAALRGLLTLDPVTRDVVLEPAPPPPVDRDAALGELTTRFAAGHGPAGVADLARWSGLPKRDLRSFEPPEGRNVRDPVPPRLLPAFDELLLAYADPLPPAVFPGGGIIRAVATVDGAIVGTWTVRDGIAWIGDAPAPAVRAELDAQLP